MLIRTSDRPSVFDAHGLHFGLLDRVCSLYSMLFHRKHVCEEHRRVPELGSVADVAYQACQGCQTGLGVQTFESRAVSYQSPQPPLDSCLVDR